MPPHPKVALVLLRCTARVTAEVCHCQCHRRRHLLSTGAAAADATRNTATANKAAMSALPISHGRFNQLESLYAASTGAKQRCSWNRGERALSFQDVGSLGIVQPTLGGAEHMHLL